MGALGWLLNLQFRGGLFVPTEPAFAGGAPKAIETRRRGPDQLETVRRNMQAFQCGHSGGAQAIETEMRIGSTVVTDDPTPPTEPDDWTHIVLASDFPTTSTTAVSSTLSFTPEASKAYWVKGLLGVKTTNTARPVRLGLAFPTGLDDQAFWIGLPHTNSASGLTVGVFGPDGAGAIAAGTSAPDATNPWYGELEGILACGASVAGSLTVEIFVAAPAGATATLVAGSWIAYQELV